VDLFQLGALRGTGYRESLYAAACRTATEDRDPDSDRRSEIERVRDAVRMAAGHRLRGESLVRRTGQAVSKAES
jgi:hypothetical protein